MLHILSQPTKSLVAAFGRDSHLSTAATLILERPGSYSGIKLVVTSEKGAGFFLLLWRATLVFFIKLQTLFSSIDMEFDWHKILFSDQPYAFFLEILFRTPLMFLAVVVILRFTGKRGVQQLSIFEMVMIITLGSAAGDSMFYDDVGILHAMAVFIMVLAVYRLLIWLITKFDKFELLMEGKPIYIIREGAMCLQELKSKELGSDEFFGSLRGQNVDQLGQIRCAVLEDTGSVSVFYFADEDVRPGLPILPEEFNRKSATIEKPGLYACTRCARTYELQPAGEVECKVCKNKEWVEAVHWKRIT